MISFFKKCSLALGFSLVSGVFASANLCAQAENPSVRTFTLDQAIDFALTNYPAVRGQVERVSAARAGVGLAKTNYLPRADLLWQSNRATRNNIFGLLMPQGVIPPISGPVLPSTSGAGVWGSAGGALLSWEPFDFGYRAASVRAARTTEDRANAEAVLTKLDVATATADSFLTLLAAQERARAARADVDRREVFAKSIHTLVDNQLRPGADASRADAELAAARIQLIQAETAEQASRASFAAILGIAGTDVKIEPGPLFGPPPESAPAALAVTSHPFAAVEKERINELRSREHILDRSYFPRFNFQSGVSERGSGANTDGSFRGGLSGLGLERANWAAGLTATFPLFDIASIRARKRIELANERAETARYDQAIQDLTGQFERARAAWEGARRVAENTPIELHAARDTEAQASARYKAGLATIVEVADAQRLLVQADIDDAVAKLNVWRALAFIAAAQGDLEPFMQLLRKKTPGGP